MNEDLKLSFFGGVGMATGANIMLKFGNTKILVDCGMMQGPKSAEEKNFETFKYNPSEIDFLLITHAHMDHIGRVPKLVREGFKGKIISTKETADLAKPMLEDAMNVVKSKFPNKILFEKNNLEKALLLWQGFDYKEKIELTPNCFLEMFDAGHILGSAILVLEITTITLKGESKKSVRIAFTGDLGNSPSPLLPDTAIPNNLDYLVMESVYGDRNHEGKKERREKLKSVILDGIKREGTIVIPAFSIERTQVLLYEINNMVEDKEIPQIPVFVDSPLAEKVTDIYKKYKKDFNKFVQQEIKSGDDIFDFPGLKIIRNFEESSELKNISGPKIILAGSGMSEGGRVVNHEAEILDDSKNTLILVGYQAVGTLGRLLQDGAKEVEIKTPPLTPPQRGGEQNKSNSTNAIYFERNHKTSNNKIKVRAKIENITGYSSHKDSERLLEFVEKINNSPHPPLNLREGETPPLTPPQRGGEQENNTNQKSHLKEIFVIMGEPHSSLFLVQRIRDYLDLPAIYPEEDKEYKLN